MEQRLAEWHKDMNCMEICGGHGSVDKYLARPGLDVWIATHTGDDSGSEKSDLHLVSSCASGRITRILLADVCGLEAHYARMSRDLRQLMKKNVNTIPQTRFVHEMGKQILHASEKGGFATSLVSTYFSTTRSFSLCNAGQPPPLLYKAKSQVWSVLKTTDVDLDQEGMPLGVVDPGEYQQFKTKLELGDLVLAFSNSLAECRNAAGRIIGTTGILQYLQKLDGMSPDGLAHNLVNDLKRGHCQNLANQDATVLLCRASDRPVRWRDNVLAPLRLMRAVSDATQFGS